MSTNHSGFDKIHYLKDSFIKAQHPINIAVAGIGATGSQFCRHLARIQGILETVDIYMNVILFDPDIVEEHNVFKQVFSQGEIGVNKALAVAVKTNRFYGTQWTAVPDKIEDRFLNGIQGYNWIIVSATDNVKARKEINKMVISSAKNLYWLDIGNKSHHGQIILGDGKSLPNIIDLYPNMKDDEFTPSCSVWDSISRQSLFINDHMATHAAELLWNLLYYKNINYHGCYINTELSIVNKIPIPNEKQHSKRP
jgi:PRTRC genetic system ThiF family protein